MIVHAKINYIKALQVTGKKFLLFLLLTYVSTQAIYFFSWQNALIPDKFIILMSSAIGIFLGFRINAAYTRWRDGYGIYRDLIATSLSITGQLNLLTKTNDANHEDFINFKKRIAYILMQYAELVRLELTAKANVDWQDALLSLHFDKMPLFDGHIVKQLLQKKRKASYVLHQLSRYIHEQHSHDKVHFIATGEIAKSLQQLYLLEQMTVSLKNTPFPWGYQFYTWLFVWLLPLLFMFSTFNGLELIHHLLIALIATIFVTTEQVARNLDNPITNPFNGAPFQALCRILEIELLECLDIPHELDFVQAKNGILT
jgi:putative membrane protein